MASVRLETLTKTFPGNVTAVSGMNLDIADGEFIVLVGPSGCGKTTTLRLIAGLDDVTSGDVFIADRRVNDMAPGDRDVAMVFQNYALYPHMSVFDNMAFGLRMRKTSKAEIESRVREAAELLALNEYLDRRPKALSGGERQRVALGRAIVRDPQVFLFDEPLSNLDAQLRVQTRTEIARLHKRLGTTTVYVTHDQVEAMTLGDRIVLMNRGVIQQVATPLEIYNRPANRFAATFMGSPAMNLFAGEVREGTFRLRSTSEATPIPVAEGVPDGPAIMGVRPEDLLVEETGTPFAKVTIEVIEPMGHETMVHFSLDDERYVARVDAKADVREGQPLQLNIRNGAIHFFADDASGSRIGA